LNGRRLEQTLFGVRFKNPVLAASGTFGYGLEFNEFFDVSLLGGFVTKAVTREPREGNPAPRVVETPSGMLNAIGLQNEGVDFFIDTILPEIESFDTNIIVNVAGATVEEYVAVCSRLDDCDAVRALEVNISCPNVAEGGMSFGSSAVSAASLVEEVRKATRKPLIVKLTPNVGDIVEIARAVEESGADALSLINTLKGMVVDVQSRRPVLANVTGGLSGPAIRPVAVRMVFEVAGKVSVPVVGVGGIFTARDALEFIIAGASLVQIGCGIFVKPRLPVEVIEGVSRYMEDHGFDSMAGLVGSITV